MRTCISTAYSAFLPVSVDHDPENVRRDVMSEMVDRGLALQQWQVVSFAIDSQPHLTGYGCPEEAFRLLGSHLRRLGTFTDADLLEFLSSQCLTHLAARLTLLENKLNSRPRHRGWREYLTLCRDATERELCRDSMALGAQLGGPEGLARTHNLLYQFGSLLEAWPTIVSAARTLDAQGHGI
jgi:hypothetical protein